jgi:ferredoxin-NADP reductase
MYVTLDYRETVAPQTISFWFKPQHPVRYIAGQYIELTLPHQADKRGQRRWFTLSSSPSEPLLAITTKLSELGSSFKRELLGLKSGTPVLMNEPMGDFVLPKDTTIPLVFIAGGIGITPFRSMVKWLQATGEHRDITLLYAARSKEDLAFYELFADYDLALRPILTAPSAGWTGESGRLNAARILALTPDNGQRLYYLSGPEPMVERLRDELLAAGVNSRQLVTDYFHGYLPL